MDGGRAEAKALDPGGNCDVAIETTVRERCEGLTARGNRSQMENIVLST
jgi:hypothetical protein